jgi:hypothetical protein
MQEVKELAMYFNCWGEEAEWGERVQLVWRVVEMVRREGYAPLDTEARKVLEALEL